MNIQRAEKDAVGHARRGAKACVHVPEGGDKDAAQRFNLRRVVVWNLRTHHRASVLCWDGPLGLSSTDIAAAMLNCWGASENTFKHLKERHPDHDHPGFALNESARQDIANPQIKALE